MPLSAAASVGDTRQDYTVNASPYVSNLVANFTSSSLAKYVNWAYRVVSRPALKYGDFFPMGYAGAPNVDQSAECLLQPSFAIALPLSGGSAPAGNGNGDAVTLQTKTPVRVFCGYV